ncbi:MAG: hypothetical protein HKL90_09740 [Elusimicrobia bacterium]|nr:hypothetical protein [Elusimicrobiota bacterium]
MIQKEFSLAFTAVACASLLLVAANAPVFADDSDWAAPMDAVTAPGALKTTSASGPAAAAAPVTDRRLLLMKGLQLKNGAGKAPFGIEAAPQLQYYGGPLLGAVKIQLVFWNPAVAYQDKLPGFYSAITQSPYFDWLSEYNVPGASLGRGSYLGAYTDSVTNPTGKIEDTDVQAELSSLIAKKAVPKPDANTLYMIYFPPGVNIDMSGSGSCQVFCAYHSSFAQGGREINYGVIPDQGGACAGGCGGDPSQFNNETSVSSHEMMEAVTDPAVGLVTGNTPQAPLGWYDGTNGEIGDICNAEQAKVGAYTVQREWSNARGLCVASADDPGAPFTPQSPAPSTGGSIAKRP